MPRRVAFVSHSMRLYGASRSLLALLEGFRAHGVETCTIIPGPGLMLQTLQAQGFATEVVAFPTWVTEREAPVDAEARRAAEARGVAAIVALLRRLRPDAVWSNTSVFATGALAAAAVELPHIWHLREASGGGEAFSFVDGSPAAMSLMRAARQRVAVSRAVQAHYEGLGSGPCTVIYNGVGAARDLAARPEPTPLRTPLRMLVAARMHREKGQVAAIEATHRLVQAGHRVALRIVGGGPLQPCREAIARLGLDAVVTLAGFIADIDAEYRGADLVLTCSSSEAMGRATAEAMSYGLPVVGCDRLGTAELIAHERTGVLCDGSADGLAGAVAWLLEHPRAARAIGARAQRVAQQRFSNDACTGAALAVLEQVGAAPAGDARHSATASHAAGATNERYRE